MRLKSFVSRSSLTSEAATLPSWDSAKCNSEPIFSSEPLLLEINESPIPASLITPFSKATVSGITSLVAGSTRQRVVGSSKPSSIASVKFKTNSDEGSFI